MAEQPRRFAYLKRVASEAYGETAKITRPKQRSQLGISIAATAIVAVVLYVFSGPTGVLDYVRLVVAGVVAFIAVFAVLFAGHFAMAPGQLAETDRLEHQATKNALAELQGSLQPRFRLVPTAIPEMPGNPAMAVISVEFEGGEARNCRGRIVGLGASRFRHSVDVPLSWAQPDSPSDPSRKSFYGSARLDVATNSLAGFPQHRDPNNMRPASAFPLDVVDQRATQIARDADVYIQVEVVADHTAPVRQWFKLRWWTYIITHNEETNEDTLWDLRNAQITFEAADQAVG